MHRLRRLHARFHRSDEPFGRFFGPGEMRLALLSLLDEEPSHGYALMTRLEARFSGAYQASPGTIYPTLQQLEDEDLVTTDRAADKKVFRITAAGERALSENAAAVARLWSRAGARGEWGGLGDPHAAEVVRPALRLAKLALRAVVKSRFDPAVVEGVRAVLERARADIEGLQRDKRTRNRK